MSELWETLTTGLVLSLIFIGVAYAFWRRYDKPTPLMIERKEEKPSQRGTQRGEKWKHVCEPKQEAELKAAYERRKAEERARSIVPASTEVKDAWKSLGVSAPTPTFRKANQDANEPSPARPNSAKRCQATTTCSTPPNSCRYARTKACSPERKNRTGN